MSWKNKAKAIKIALVCLCAGFVSMAALAAEPVRGGTLRLALRIPTASLDPLFGNAPGTDRKIYNLFAENLLYQDEDGKFNPGLAKNWTISADGLSIMFDLRAGVKFQDGTSMDAAAVKFNFDRFLDPKITAASAINPRPFVMFWSNLPTIPIGHHAPPTPATAPAMSKLR